MEYTIETHVIDVAQREVRRQDACVPVEPKVFDLLLYLVENRARVVAKDELVERIWNGRAISDAALSSCVKAARRALGDDRGREHEQERQKDRCFHCSLLKGSWIVWRQVQLRQLVLALLNGCNLGIIRRDRLWRPRRGPKQTLSYSKRAVQFARRFSGS